MSRHTRLSFVLAFVALLSLAAVAQSPIVYNTSADFSLNPAQLTINGNNFGVSTPTVLFDNVPLTLFSYTNTQIVALLPANTLPGSYLITVRQYQKTSGVAFYSALGAVGPQGPQ